VWDAPTRLGHWLMVLLVAAAYATDWGDWPDWHAWSGEALLALLLFRVFWGLWGSETARFGQFVCSPVKAIRHLRHLSRREPDVQVGHNAAGGWMVLIMLALLLGETLTGVFVNNDVADQGPLTQLVPVWMENLITNLHAILANALLAAVALHLLAIGAYGVVKRQDLVRPMLTGRKRLPGTLPAPRMASMGLALILILGATAVVALVADRL
jgi:cytochrome b